MHWCSTKQERGKQWDGKPPIPNYLGECFLKIANHLSYRPNFINYTFRDDMISDGIENCLQLNPLSVSKADSQQSNVQPTRIKALAASAFGAGFGGSCK